MANISDLLSITFDDDTHKHILNGSSLELSHNNINIVLEYNNYKITNNKSFNSDHLFRYLNKKFKNYNFDQDTFCDFIFESKYFINNFYKLCTICSSEIIHTKNIINYCNNCFEEFCGMITSNTIIDLIKEDSKVVHFLLLTAFDAISEKTRNVFTPCHSKFNNNIIIKQFSNKNVFETIFRSNFKSDYDILNEYGNELYCFFKFVILTNKTDMISYKIDDELFYDNNIAFDNLSVFQLRQNKDIEKKFFDDQPQFLYHGSSRCNMYSIMRNGLKNLSGTKMMTNGAAHGNGIYLSDSANMSLGYSNRNINSSVVVLLVVQLLNKNLYNKGGSIFVVTNENDILLRYIVLVDSKNIAKIQNYFSKLSQEVSIANKTVFKITNKRLCNEIKLLNKIDVNVETTSELEWLINYNNNKYLIKLDDYPIVPPSIFLMNQNEKLNKYTNNNNMFVLDILDQKLRNIKTDLKKIIVHINGLNS